VKKLILLFVILAIVFVVLEKHRLYVRDPLANVTRNGVKEDGAQVFINFDNDVLIENDSAPDGMYVELIQHGQPIGTPAMMHGLHWMAHLTDADQPKLVSVRSGAQIESMDSKVVKFMDDGKRETVVTLR